MHVYKNLIKYSMQKSSGWFQKMSCVAWTFYPPPSHLACLQKFQNALPPCPWISKMLTSPSLWNFLIFFFRAFGNPVWLRKTSNEQETCNFLPPFKKILLTIFNQANKQLKFVVNIIILSHKVLSLSCLSPTKTFCFQFLNFIFLGVDHIDTVPVEDKSKVHYVPLPTICYIENFLH